MNIIEEYLVTLGFKDNLTDKLASTLQNGSQKVSSFVGRWGKQWVLAGGAVVSGLAAGSMGIAKFIGNLVKTSDELDQMARYSRFSRDELFKTKSALDTMGKSLAEVRANPLLYRQFVELRKEAEQLKPPDMREGLNQAREISFEFTKLKQVGGAAIQWVGFYLLKYIEKPMQQVREKLGGITEKVSASMPVWTQKIGQALSWMVRLGMALIRGASRVYTAIQRVFDMIPRNVKIAMAALAAFGMFIRAGPVGRLIAVLSVALLLLEDFFTYLDGGDALLGGVWKSLIDIFDGFTQGGENALSFFSDKFLPGLIKLAGQWLPKLVETVFSFIGPVTEFGTQVITGLIDTISKSFPQLLELASLLFVTLLSEILDQLPILLDVGAGILQALIVGFIAMLPKLSETASHFLSQLLTAFHDRLPEIILSGKGLIQALTDGLATGLPIAIAAFASLADSFLQMVMDSLPMLMDAGISFIHSLILGIADALPAIIRAIIDLLNRLLESIIDHLPEIVQAGIQIIMALIDGIVQALPSIVLAIADLISSLRLLIISHLPQIIQAGIQIILALIQGLWRLNGKLAEAVIKIAQKIPEGILSLHIKMKGAGVKLLKALWEGILSMGGWLKDKVTGFFSGIWNGAKDLFGSGDESQGNQSPSDNSPPNVPNPSDNGPSPVQSGTPTTGIPPTNNTKLPGHAEGGLFNREHVARFAEKNQPEAVLPLTKPERTAEILQQAAQFFGSKTAGTDTSKLLSQMESFLTKAEGLLTKMNSLIQPGTSTISNTNSSIVNNNQTYDMKATYNIYDSSGNPQITAKAVDRQQQLRIRNMQGVLM